MRMRSRISGVAEPEWQRADVIGFHGQTVLHRPHRGVTVQLGDGALLARETGIAGRPRHARQRHGASAGRALRWCLPITRRWRARCRPSSRDDYPVVFVNIGGISTLLTCREMAIPIAFDTGPGNTLIDQWVSREGGVPFDAGGAIAQRGRRRSVGRRALSRQSVLRKAGPKSLDRNDFTLALAEGLELADGARTLAAVSAEAILKSVDHLPEQPKLWIVCGGGRKNPHIVGDLSAGAEKAGAKVIVAEDAGSMATPPKRKPGRILRCDR